MIFLTYHYFSTIISSFTPPPLLLNSLLYKWKVVILEIYLLILEREYCIFLILHVTLMISRKKWSMFRTKLET